MLWGERWPPVSTKGPLKHQPSDAKMAGARLPILSYFSRGKYQLRSWLPNTAVQFCSGRRTRRYHGSRPWCTAHERGHNIFLVGIVFPSFISIHKQTPSAEISIVGMTKDTSMLWCCRTKSFGLIWQEDKKWTGVAIWMKEPELTWWSATESATEEREVSNFKCHGVMDVRGHKYPAISRMATSIKVENSVWPQTCSQKLPALHLMNGFHGCDMAQSFHCLISNPLMIKWAPDSALKDMTAEFNPRSMFWVRDGRQWISNRAATRILDDDVFWTHVNGGLFNIQFKNHKVEKATVLWNTAQTTIDLCTRACGQFAFLCHTNHSGLSMSTHKHLIFTDITHLNGEHSTFQSAHNLLH